MSTLKKVKLRNEKELHGVVEKELDALEEGLKLLKYEFGLAKRTPDFLCVDSGGCLVVIEVKLQEDENILFQALRYYNEIDKEKYPIAKMFHNRRIDPVQHPRVLLIAERFSDDIRRLSTLVVPDIELYEYTVVVDARGKHGIVYHRVSLPKIDEFLTKPATIQDHREYITKKEIRRLFDKIRQEIKRIGDGIEEYPTQGYLGFKHRGRQIAWLARQRKSFDLGAHIIDADEPLRFESIRIETGDEDYTTILERIKKSFGNLGGKTNRK